MSTEDEGLTNLTDHVGTGALTGDSGQDCRLRERGGVAGTFALVGVGVGLLP